MKRFLSLCLALLLLFPALAGCAEQQPEPQSPSLLIHYVVAAPDQARGGDAIRGVETDLSLAENATLEEQAAAVVNKLLEQPQDSHLQSALPSVELLGITVQGRRAIVDLSRNFNRLTGVELTLANSCLVLSLSQLDGINAVSVTVQGRAAVQQPQQAFYEWNVLLSSMDDVRQTTSVTLYFADSTGTLVGETRVLEIYEGQPVVETLVLELLKGPESRELTAIFPEEFFVNSVRVEGGVCYINLPQSSIALLPEDVSSQRLMLLSLARSLYSLDTITSLRLSADGEELESFGDAPLSEVSPSGKPTAQSAP